MDRKRQIKHLVYDANSSNIRPSVTSTYTSGYVHIRYTQSVLVQLTRASEHQLIAITAYLKFPILVMSTNIIIYYREIDADPGHKNCCFISVPRPRNVALETTLKSRKFRSSANLAVISPIAVKNQ